MGLHRLLRSLIASGLLIGGGCAPTGDASGEEMLCRRAADHLEACLGEPASVTESCTAERASNVLERSCDDLRASRGKGDLQSFLCSTFGLFCPELAPLDGVTELAAGTHHTCAIREGTPADDVYCWGYNRNGFLGVEGNHAKRQGKLILYAHPVRAMNEEELRNVAPEADRFEITGAAAGREHTCALVQPHRCDGRRDCSPSVPPYPQCWGDNARAQSGNGSTYAIGRGSSDTPQGYHADGRMLNTQEVVAGLYHGCARTLSDAIPPGADEPPAEVFCWGRNEYGQTGRTASETPQKLPRIVGTGFDSRDLAAGDHFACAALEPHGAVKCWGRDDRGQLGDGGCGMEGCHRSDVVTVRLQESGDSLTGVRQLVAGARHVCAITESDEVVCWGDNAEGQLGSRAGARISQGVRLPFSGTARKLALGASHTCLLSAEGRVRCWGAHGLDGDASQGGVRDIVTGHDHTCLLNKRGEVHCWGTNDRGQLGRNETSQSETRPAAVLSR